MIFINPEFAVREQEVKHFVLAVIEAERIPCRVLAAACVGVEILVVGAIESAKAFCLILHGVAMNDVHNHCYAARVSVIDKRLEVLRSTKAARSSEEARHVVAERSIIWMLLDSHNLNGIVAVGMNTRKHIFAEFFIRTHLFGILTHAYVALIYQ